MKLHTTLLFVLILTSSTLMAQEVDTDKLFYQAVYAEQIDGDLEKARSLYQQIIKAKPTDRTIMAKTLYRLGLITEKDGAKQALGFYTKVVEEYPEQKDLIQLVQSRVDKLEDANTFIDERDGHKYKYVQIGNQIWMAENLAYMPHVNPFNKQEWGIWVYDFDDNDLATAKSTGNFQKYGCLYDWAMAMDIEPRYLYEPWNGNSENHQGICPPGWHLPTDEEWKTLEKKMGMPDSVANDLGGRRAFLRTTVIKDGKRVYDRSRSFMTIELTPEGRYLKASHGWNSDGNGDGSSGFDVLPAGSRWTTVSNKPGSLGYEGGFWTASEGDSMAILNAGNRDIAYIRDFGSEDDIFRGGELKTNGFSVRCIKTVLKPGETIRPSESAVKKITTPDLIGRQPGDPEVIHVKPELLWENMDLKSYSYFPNYMVFYDDIILTNTSERVEGANTENTVFQIHAVKLETGEELWSTRLGSSLISKPVIDHDIAYCSTGKKGILGINLKSGDIIWEYQTEGAAYKIQVQDSVLYASGKQLIAIDLFTREILWKFAIKDQTISGFTLDKDKIIACPKTRYNTPNLPNYGLNLVAVNILNGQKMWEFEDQKNTMIVNPVVYDSIVLFRNSSGNCFAINKYNGKKYWKSFSGNFSRLNILKFGRFIYLPNYLKSELLCLDLKQGNNVWSFSTNQLFVRKPIMYRNRLVIFDSQDQCAIGLDPISGRQIWEFSLPGITRGFSEIENDRICIASDDGLYYYDLRNLK